MKTNQGADGQASDTATDLERLSEHSQSCLWLLKRFSESVLIMLHEGPSKPTVVENRELRDQLELCALEVEDSLRRPQFSRVEAAECWALARLARRVCIQHWDALLEEIVPIREVLDGALWRDLQQHAEDFDERRIFLTLELVRLGRIATLSSAELARGVERSGEGEWAIEYDPAPRVIYRGHDLGMRRLEVRYIAAFVAACEPGAPPLQRSKEYIEKYLAEGAADSTADLARREDDQRQNVNEMFNKASRRTDGPRWIGFQVTPIDRKTGRRMLKVGIVEHVPSSS